MAFNCLKINSFKNGVTLTELLVGMAIAGGVSLGIVSIYMAHYRIFTNQNALIEAETQNKLAMDQILKYVHEGMNFSRLSGICDGTPYGSSYVDRTELTTVGIQLLPLDSNGNPFESGNYDHILFYRNPLDESKLVRVGYSNSTSTSRTEAQNNPLNCGDYPLDGKVIATGVTEFSIEYDDPPATFGTGNFVNSKKGYITLTTESKTIYGRTFTSTQKFTAYFK